MAIIIPTADPTEPGSPFIPELRAALEGLDGVADGIGSTSTDGFSLVNNTPATVGAQQWSPRLRWTGQGWKTNVTAGSQTVDMIAELVPIQGAANPSSSLVFRSRVNAGAFADILTLSSNGNADVAGRLKQSGIATDLGYLQSNGSLLASTTALNPGIAFFGGNGVQDLYGADLGYNSTTSRYRTRIFSGASGSDVAFGYQTNAQTSALQSAFTEQMTLRGDSGKLGLGIVNPLEVIHLARTGVVGICLDDLSIAGNKLTIANGPSFGPILAYITDSANLSTFNQASVQWAPSSYGHAFQTSPSTAIGIGRSWTTALWVNSGRNGTAGNVGIGAFSFVLAPAAKLHSLATTEQLRLGYDAANYVSYTVSSIGNLTVAPTGGTFAVTGALTASTSVSTPLLVSPSNLTITSGGTLINITSSARLQSNTYASQTTGWAITGSGDADFRYIYTDELHAKSFIADLEQALAGGQIISKSVAELNADFTLPAAGAAGTLVIKDLPSAAGMAVFQSGDIVRLRQFSRASGALTIADAWGVVTGFVNNGNGTQNWTYTRSSGALAGTATGTINAKTLALDYGTTGNGFYEVNAIDGTYGVNSPYWQIATWATHPQNGMTVRARGGNLLGITGTTEYGLYAGNGFGATNKFFRITDVNFQIHNIPVELYDGGTIAISLQPSGPYFALGNPMPTTFLEASTEGVWMGKVSAGVYSMRVGKTDGAGALTAGFKWDGSTDTLSVIGSGTFSGTITATAGAIGGWTIDTTSIRNSGSTVMLRGAGNLAFGSTPPTSASSGTGLFLDSTGMYGLASSVVQAKFDAATGKITAGAGAVSLGVDGITFTNGLDPQYQIKFMDGSGSLTDLSGLVWVFRSGGPPTTSFRLRGRSLDADTTGTADTFLSAQNAFGDETIILLRKYGHSHSVKPDAGIVSIFATKGVMIDSGGTTEPSTSTVLELNSTVGAFLPPRMTTTQRDALTAIDGMIIYNSTTGALNYRKAGAWVAI